MRRWRSAVRRQHVRHSRATRNRSGDGRIDMSTTTPGSWIYEKGSVSGGGGGGGTGLPAPPVSIEPPAEVIFRSDHRVEVDVQWNPDAKATKANFLGCAVYLEDPDISSGANHILD